MPANELQSIIDEIHHNQHEQIRIGVTQTVTWLRLRLESVRHEQMLPLTRLARRVFVGEATIEGALRVPHKRAPSDDIIGAALNICSALDPHRELLRENKIDLARLDRLDTEVRDIRTGLTNAYDGMADRAVPTHRITALFKAARLEAIALDALVGTESNKELLTHWKISRRVGKRPRRPRNCKAKTTSQSPVA